jgi:pectinesterase
LPELLVTDDGISAEMTGTACHAGNTMKTVSLTAALLISLSLSFTAVVADDSAPAPARKVRIVLVGDSTVTDASGWGVGFARMLNDKAECKNTAAGGRSSKSFIDEGKWTNALALKGDYYVIQFGHNDEPGKGPERETDPATTFTANMTRYVEEARAIGAQPILVTSLTRRQWDKSGNGKINSSLVPYVEAVKKVAAYKNVPLIDLHTRSIDLCESLGREGCLAFSPMKVVDGTNAVDNTHLNEKGSLLFGRIVAEEVRGAVPELRPCLIDAGSAAGLPRAVTPR